MSSRPISPRASLARAVVLLAAVTLAGCASSSGGLRTGEQAERAQDYDLAVAEYTKAVRERLNAALGKRWEEWEITPRASPLSSPAPVTPSRC